MIGLLAALALAPSPYALPVTKIDGTIAVVVDADTYRVRLGQRDMRAAKQAWGRDLRTKDSTVYVRLAGIDAPESYALRFGYVQCGGAPAKTWAKERFLGEHVRIALDPKQGVKLSNGRIVGYLVRDNGADIGEAVVAYGHARVATEYPGLLTNRYLQVQTGRVMPASAWEKC